MKIPPRIVISIVVTVFLFLAVFLIRPPQPSFGQQNYPPSSRVSACGCYVCGLLLAVNFPDKAPNCAGILATDACPVEMARMPLGTRRAFCKELRERSKNPSMDECLNLRGACDDVAEDEPSPETACEKPTPWFDRSSPCTDVQSPVVEIRAGGVNLTMCGLRAFRWESNDPLALQGYVPVLKEWVRSKLGDKICCSSMQNASRTGKPCDPASDIDCDGKPNQSDINNTYSGAPMPDINLSTSPQGAVIDPFPAGLDPNAPDFRPELTGRNSKGVGECACKWELIKGDMKCSRDRAQQHVYTATWRCPSTKAEVFTTKTFPGSSPCR